MRINIGEGSVLWVIFDDMVVIIGNHVIGGDE